MSTSLVQVELPVKPPFALTQAQTILRHMVLDSVVHPLQAQLCKSAR
jgi:hypothetical protein